MSLEGFDVRKEDLVLILVTSKSCQNQCREMSFMKLRQRDLKQEQSYNIVQAESQKQSVIQTILHFETRPFDDSLQLFGSAKNALYVMNCFACVGLLSWLWCF